MGQSNLFIKYLSAPLVIGPHDIITDTKKNKKKMLILANGNHSIHKNHKMDLVTCIIYDDRHFPELIMLVKHLSY